MGAVVGFLGRSFAKFLLWLGRSPVGQALFTLLIEKIATAIQNSISRERARRQAIADAQKTLERLKNAKTKEEIEAAIPSSLDKF